MKQMVDGTWRGQGRAEVSFWWELQRQGQTHHKEQMQIAAGQERGVQGLKQGDQRIQRHFLPEEEDLVGRKEF